VDHRRELREHVRVITGPEREGLRADAQLGLVIEHELGRRCELVELDFGGPCVLCPARSAQPELLAAAEQPAEPLSDLLRVGRPPEQALALAAARAAIDAEAHAPRIRYDGRQMGRLHRCLACALVIALPALAWAEEPSAVQKIAITAKPSVV